VKTTPRRAEQGTPPGRIRLSWSFETGSWNRFHESLASVPPLVHVGVDSTD
jgi:hypothetical protein